MLLLGEWWLELPREHSREASLGAISHGLIGTRRFKLVDLECAPPWDGCVAIANPLEDAHRVGAEDFPMALNAHVRWDVLDHKRTRAMANAERYPPGLHATTAA